MTTPAIESIVNTPGSEIDARTALQHVGRRVLLELTARNIAHAREYVQVDILGGHRAIVKLAADDTYSIEIGRVTHSNGDIGWEVEGQEHDLSPENVGEVLLDTAIEVINDAR